MRILLTAGPKVVNAAPRTLPRFSASVPAREATAPANSPICGLAFSRPASPEMTPSNRSRIPELNASVDADFARMETTDPRADPDRDMARRAVRLTLVNSSPRLLTFAVKLSTPSIAPRNRFVKRIWPRTELIASENLKDDATRRSSVYPASVAAEYIPRNPVAVCVVNCHSFRAAAAALLMDRSMEPSEAPFSAHAAKDAMTPLNPAATVGRYLDPTSPRARIPRVMSRMPFVAFSVPCSTLARRSSSVSSFVVATEENAATQPPCAWAIPLMRASRTGMIS